jgi:hypothetical protein
MHCFINDPDSSLSLSYIYIWSWFLPRHCLTWSRFFPIMQFYKWSWFFPVSTLYMIMMLPRHALSYSGIWSYFFSVTVLCMILIDSSPSLSYIWSWFFPVTVLYMILILPCHCLIIWSWIFPATLIYDPDSSPSLSYHRRSWHGPPPFFLTFCLQIYFQ